MVAMGGAVKGDAYEGLLERNAQDIKSGAAVASRRTLIALDVTTSWYGVTTSVQRRAKSHGPVRRECP